MPEATWNTENNFTFICKDLNSERIGMYIDEARHELMNNLEMFQGQKIKGVRTKVAISKMERALEYLEKARTVTHSYEIV